MILYQDITEAISLLSKEAYSNSKAHGFWNGPNDDARVKFLLMITEIAEAFEETRKFHGLDYIYEREDGKPEGVPIELADALIRIFDFAGRYKIDLAQAIVLKMRYNAGRPPMHGKAC